MYPQRVKWFHDPIWETVLWTLIVLGSCVILALFAQSQSRAAWGPGGCGPVGPRVVASEESPLTGWRFFQGRYYYYRDGIQIAGWDPKQELYRAYDAAHDVWSAPKRAPWQADCKCCPSCSCSACACPTHGPCCEACTCVAQARLPKWMTHGVQVERLNSREHYTLNGHEAGDALIPDDAKRTRLIIIGTEAEQKRVSEDLNKDPILAPLARDLVVHNYRPDHWHVARAGYETNGHPSVYLVSADGKVLSRSTSYAGPEKLAEAIRKADPKYDPSKDPDLTKSQSQATFSVPLSVMGGLLLLFLLLGKRS